MNLYSQLVIAITKNNWLLDYNKHFTEELIIKISILDKHENNSEPTVL